VGSDRQGVSIRDGRGERLTGRPLSEGARSSSSTTSCSGPTTRRVSVLLGDRGRVRRLRRPPGQPRRHAFGGVAGALAKLQAYKRRMGWTFPWASSFGSDFNSDFSVGFTQEQQREGGIQYNYRREAGLSPEAGGEGLSPSRGHVRNRRRHVHAREAGHERVRARGRHCLPHLFRLCAWPDGLWGMYQWLDRAPKGRNETGVWWRRHDEYDNSSSNGTRRSR